VKIIVPHGLELLLPRDSRRRIRRSWFITAVSEDHRRIQTSLDGISWTDALLTANWLLGVAHGQGSHVVTELAGFILQSSTVTLRPGS
jgi:hypothetical protein